MYVSEPKVLYSYTDNAITVDYPVNSVKNSSHSIMMVNIGKHEL